MWVVNDLNRREEKHRLRAPAVSQAAEAEKIEAAWPRKQGKIRKICVAWCRKLNESELDVK